MLVNNFGVIERGADLVVAQKFLDERNIGPILQKMRRITVAQRMNPDCFMDPCFFHGVFKNVLGTSDRVFSTILTFKKEFFGTELAVIIPKLRQDTFGKIYVCLLYTSRCV